jgi:hypothetical protein
VYDFNFLDLRKDKLQFLDSLTNTIQEQLPENCWDISIKSIELGDCYANLTKPASSTIVIINFNYTQTFRLQKPNPKTFLDWLLFRKTTYEVIHKNEFKEGKLILSYNDNSVSSVWEPVEKKVIV